MCASNFTLLFPLMSHQHHTWKKTKFSSPHCLTCPSPRVESNTADPDLSEIKAGFLSPHIKLTSTDSTCTMDLIAKIIGSTS